MALNPNYSEVKLALNPNSPEVKLALNPNSHKPALPVTPDGKTSQPRARRCVFEFKFFFPFFLVLYVYPSVSSVGKKK